MWRQEKPSPHLKGHVDRAFTQFSPDGNLLAYSSFNGMSLWDVARQETITTFTGDVWSVTFSPDGTLLAYLENSGGISIRS